ncbi:MAG TPA: hypothetical protein VHO70_13630, partial [Chitinispirillaceae bacterium]|nr:hypothetical protein [Chitinispirillaceae bacterium]
MRTSSRPEKSRPNLFCTSSLRQMSKSGLTTLKITFFSAVTPVSTGSAARRRTINELPGLYDLIDTLIVLLSGLITIST